ncbi:MAG: XdhC/CoxI family protein [Flavobacteriaceae bacterium]|nr:XdhC/CoxI family protein [Flavobacteriaceae bacterium]
MTHELHQLLKAHLSYHEHNQKVVLVTLVSLNGSSYRKPGVRMMITESGQMIGAVSGGCVEKEIKLQAQEVFQTNKPKMMTYDGRYRLGCEGILHLLIEPMALNLEETKSIIDHLENRGSLSVSTHYQIDIGLQPDSGSLITVSNQVFPIHSKVRPEGKSVFTQNLPALFELFIFGAEHDSVALSEFAEKLGWQVTIVAPADEQKSIEHFTGAANLLTPLYDQVAELPITAESAVMLMTHNLSKDVQYLCALSNTRPAYLGLLGPARRREQLIAQLLDFRPETDDTFIELLRGPAGIDIGALSAHEIAVSIIGEILAVTRSAKLIPLKEKAGAIHD